MAALLTALALMTLAMSVLMPTWRHAVQREREAELIWRGQQYDRAVQLYRRKNSAPGAPNLDILINGRYLRKKYKDPITGGDFELKPVAPGGLNVPGGGAGVPGRPGVPATTTGRPQAEGPRQPQRAEGQLIGGVRSKSKQKSIRVLNGRDRYDQWEFTYVPYTSGPTINPAVGGPGNTNRPTQPGLSRPGASRPGQTQPTRSPFGASRDQ